MVKFINGTVAVLVLLLAIVSLILSYSALVSVAQSYSKLGGLSYLWPFLIDGALIVFSLAVVGASLRAETSKWAWCLVGVFTVGTIAFNIIHSEWKPVAILVAIVPPIALFLSFETLMAMLKNSVKRSEMVKTLDQLAQLVQGKRLELDTMRLEKESLLIEYGDRTKRAEATLQEVVHAIETKRQEVASEIEAIARGVEEERDRLEATLVDLDIQIEAKRKELEAVTSTGHFINVWDLVGHIDPAHLDTKTRQFFVAILSNAKVPQRDIAQWTGKSIKTIQRDIVDCNGFIKREG